MFKISWLEQETAIAWRTLPLTRAQPRVPAQPGMPLQSLLLRQSQKLSGVRVVSKFSLDSLLILISVVETASVTAISASKDSSDS